MKKPNIKDYNNLTEYSKNLEEYIEFLEKKCESCGESILDVREKYMEDIRKDLQNFFNSRKVSHRTIKKFRLEINHEGIDIIPEEPYFEESYIDEDADILIEAIGKKYGVNRLGWVHWVYRK